MTSTSRVRTGNKYSARKEHYRCLNEGVRRCERPKYCVTTRVRNKSLAVQCSGSLLIEFNSSGFRLESTRHMYEGSLLK